MPAIAGAWARHARCYMFVTNPLHRKHTMTDLQIAEKSKKWALAFARKLNLARHMVDELAQEAAIGILKAAKGYNPALSTFDQRAYVYADFMMSRHLKALGGVVNCPRDNRNARPSSVGLVSRERATEDSRGVFFDDRSVEALALDEAAFNQALESVDARTGLMIEAKMKGATYEEIADGLGVSREYVRKRVLAFAENLSERAP